MIGVVVSRADEASRRIGEALLSLGEWRTTVDGDRPDAGGGGAVHRRDGIAVRTFDALHLDLEGAAAVFEDPAMVVFASRHAGETGPLLSTHATGNWGPAEHGGRDRELAPAAPNAMRATLRALDRHAPEGYDVSMECTHHGPTAVGAPSLFVELGSGPEQWADSEGAAAVARSIADLAGTPPHREQQVVVLGGGHYAPRATRVATETGWAVGHVAADWSLEAMGDPREATAVLGQAFERSRASVALAVEDRPAIAAAVEALGHRVVDETWLRETDRVPRRLVERLEDRFGPVSDGLRFGRPARGADGAAAVTVAALPPELLERAFGVDGETTRAAVAERALAFRTTEGGTRPTGEVALASPADRSAMIDALASVLEAGYDAVERREGAVVAREVALDPAAAREAGVPEGPAFGRLADGEPVEVDGETVRPEDVRRERVDRFPV